MPLFRKTIIFLILLELLSIFAWQLPAFNLVCSLVILGLVFILALKNLSAGLLIALGELIIGSHGYLFSLNIGQGSTLISIRLGIFLVVMLAFAIQLVKKGLINYWQELKTFRFFRYYLLLAIAIIWGFAWGLIRGNDFGNIFLDFNNWLFFLYLLPLISVSQEEKFWLALRNVALSCLVWLIFKTLLFFYIFAHQFLWALPEAYLWVRDTRVGEITRFTDTFYRVFFQSQIYALLGFFIFLPLVKKVRITYYSLLSIVCLSAVLVSLSRSFWVGVIIALVIYFLFLIYQLRVTHYTLRVASKTFLQRLLLVILIILVSFALLFTVAYAPPQISGNLANLFRDRATEVEAAGSSRINMLKPLLLSIVNHPVIGSGFGTTVTYQSADPRIIPATAGGTGEFTTYAFEWGYLDLLLKIGLAGLFVYLLLIYKLLCVVWQQTKSAISNQRSAISNSLPGLFLSLLALLTVNVFTPYLNHPLGIGFILIISVWLNCQQAKELSSSGLTRGSIPYYPNK